MDNILSTLSEEQRVAATTTEGNIRLAAGAGSGKTHTLTTRVAYICHSKDIAPSRILSLTFTNKAAEEMRERVAKKLGVDEQCLNMMTFHKLALLICKKFLSKIGYPTTTEDGEEVADIVIGPTPVASMANEMFLQYKDSISQMEPGDSDTFEQAVVRYTKSIIKGYDYVNLLLEEDGELASPMEIVNYEVLKADCKKTKDALSKNKLAIRKKIKESFTRDAAHYILLKELREVETEIQNTTVAYDGVTPTMSWARKLIKMKIATKVLDFDDLIMFALYLLKNFEDVREYWQSQFDYIQVDEFQDTDYRQLEMLQIISEKSRGTFVVGDPDQSIYQFRGVCPEIFNNLDIYFKDLKTIFMEDNYRSSKAVITSANSIITLNQNRLKKELKFKSGIEDMEAPLICVGTDKLSAAQMELGQIGKMLKAGVNPNDICILYRDRTCPITEELVRYLKQYNIPLDCQFKPYSYPGTFEDIVMAMLMYKHSGGSENFLGKFLDLIYGDDFNGVFDKMQLQDIQTDNESIYGFIASIYPKKFSVKGNPIGNYKKFVENEGAVKQVVADTIDYWNNLSEEEKDDLCSEEKQMNTEQADAEGIHIMTIHKSKGLEFPYVFVHMDNDKCPKLGNQTDFNSLEEDVRLAYVAVSRAKKQVYLCFSDATTMSPFIAQSCSTIEPIHGASYVLPDAEALKRNINDFNSMLDMYFFLKGEGVYRLRTADGIIAGYRYMAVIGGSRYYFQSTAEKLVEAGVEPPQFFDEAVVMLENGKINTYEEIHGTVPVVNITDLTDIRNLFNAENIFETIAKYI